MTIVSEGEPNDDHVCYVELFKNGKISKLAIPQLHSTLGLIGQRILLRPIIESSKNFYERNRNRQAQAKATLILSCILGTIAIGTPPRAIFYSAAFGDPQFWWGEFQEKGNHGTEILRSNMILLKDSLANFYTLSSQRSTYLALIRLCAGQTILGIRERSLSIIDEAITYCRERVSIAPNERQPEVEEGDAVRALATAMLVRAKVLGDHRQIDEAISPIKKSGQLNE